MATARVTRGKSANAVLALRVRARKMVHMVKWKNQLLPKTAITIRLSLLSLIVMAVFGRSWFFHFTMWTIFLALTLSANTAFADFPRVTRAVAMSDYLPHVFTLRGRRLLFSAGIYGLTGPTAIILIIFSSDIDKMISLYAIGAFLAFTLSQAGMVMHWKKQPGEHKGRYWHMFVNGTGAVATGITTVIR